MRKHSHDECIELLEAAGLVVDETLWERLERHLALVVEWNRFAGLTSQGDLQHLLVRHTVDSLSLAPIVHGFCGAGGQLLDIGTGGGFPAIPLKLVLSTLEVTLVERSTKKVGYLRKAMGALELQDVTLVQGEYPNAVPAVSPQIITARAVERPQRVLQSVAQRLEPGTTFLCQSGDPSQVLDDTFHVERVEDAWSERGLRRGSLHLVTRTFHVEQPCT